MRRRTVALVALIGAFALVTGACAVDPATSKEYTDLQLELEAVTHERDRLAADLGEVSTSLTSAKEEKQTALATARAAEEERAHETERRSELERNLVAAATSLDSAFDLTALEAASWLSCGDLEMTEQLPGQILELREQLAATADWFDTAYDYDMCESHRAFVNSDNAVTRQRNSALTEVWDRYWAAEYGSEEEALAYYEFTLRRLLAALEEIESARSVMEDAIPAGYENANEA